MGCGSSSRLGRLRWDQVDAVSASDRLADSAVGGHLRRLVIELGFLPGPVAKPLDVRFGELVADCALDRKLLAEGVVGIVESVRSSLDCQRGES